LGSIINFTGIQIYDKNVFKFDEYMTSLEFYEPYSSERRVLESNKIRYDGLYIATVNEVSVDKSVREAYYYIRFYKNGKVIKQTVSEFFPLKVSRWLGPDSADRMGNYFINDDQINFVINNQESSTIGFEGPISENFSGNILNPDELQLEIKLSGQRPDLPKPEQKTYVFKFYQDVVEKQLMYEDYGFSLYLPGKWELKNEITGGQKFFLNDSGTVCAVNMRSYR
jgi:hypothetical protein